MVGGNLRRCSGGVAAIGAYAPPVSEGSRIRHVPSFRERVYCETDQNVWTAAVPVRVERPRDVFNPSVLKVRWVPGVASYRTPYQQTVFLLRHPMDLKTWDATPLQPVW